MRPARWWYRARRYRARRPQQRLRVMQSGSNQNRSGCSGLGRVAVVQTEAALPAFRTICFAFALEPVRDNSGCGSPRAGRGVAGEQERLDADGNALIRGEAARGSVRVVRSLRVKLEAHSVGTIYPPAMKHCSVTPSVSGVTKFVLDENSGQRVRDGKRRSQSSLACALRPTSS